MKKIYLIGLLFIFVTGAAQNTPNTWQQAADQHLNVLMNGDLMFEEHETKEALKGQLIREFKNGNLDISLHHLLAAWANEDGDPDAMSYFEALIARYGSSNPYRLALLILDCAEYASDNTARVQAIQRGLTLLSTAKKDSSILYVLSLSDLAFAQLSLKEYSRSYESLNKALDMAERIAGKHSALYTDLLGSIAYYHKRTGNEEKEAEYEKHAKQIEADFLGINQPYHFVFDDHPLPYYRGTANSEVGDRYKIAALFQYQTNYVFRRALASELYREVASVLAKDPSQELDYAAALFNHGVVDFVLDRKSAAKTLQQAVAIYEKHASSKLDLKFTFIDASNFLACAYLENKQYNDAIRTFQRVQKFFDTDRLRIYDWYKRLYHNIILAYHRGGVKEKVISLLQPYYAGNSYSSENDFTQRYTLYGDMLFGFGEYAKAFTAYERAYTDYWDAPRRELEHSGQTTDWSGEPMEFIDGKNIVLDIGANEAVNIVHKYKPSGEQYTRFLYKYAQAAFQISDYHTARKAILDYINEFYTQIENSHINHERGSDLVEIYRLKEELFPAYDLFQNIIMTDSVAGADFQADDRMRGYMQILDSKANIQYHYRHMRNAIENGNDEFLKKTLREYIARRQELVQLKLSKDANQEDLERLKISIDTLKSYMSAKTAYFDQPSKKFVYSTDVRKNLKANEAAIEIRRFPLYANGQWTDDVVYGVYVLKSNSDCPEVVFLRNGRFLESRAVKQYQNSVRVKLDDTLSYNYFWRPIRPLLQGVSTVYLSSDGVYSQINVNTLLNPETQKYLVEEISVYHVVSSKALNEIDDLRGSVKSALLMGRPAYYIDVAREQQSPNPFEEDLDRAITRAQIASGNIADLPGTEKEILSIEKIMKAKGVKTQYFVGKNSTEEAFKKSGGEVLHLATHGFWFKEDSGGEKADAMFNSGLLLAGVKNYYEHNSNSTEDGILTAYEVQGLNLNNTKLVVLSACETAVGHVEAGEGVYGLQRAFVIAGADKIIMSLWKVDDAATQELFTSFYREWIGSGRSISEAFNLAQNTIRKKYRNPYYWGAFILVD